MPSEFRTRLRATAEAAVLVGVRLAIIAALLIVAIGFVMGDYAIVRQRAANGQAAYEFIQQQIKASTEKK